MDMVTLRRALEAENYIFDEEFLITVYVALKLEKPLLIEGSAGVGKTEVAKVLSNVFGTQLIRLQCYEGLDESKSLYEWNYQKQLLKIQARSLQNNNNDLCPIDNNGFEDLFGKEFLLERPLIKAINSDRKAVLLIDEIDKTDEEFEAFLLELLSDFQVSIPELGTIKAKNKPVVILTSNNTRQLSDALKRRCAYLYIEYPDVEKEVRIINSKIPGISSSLARDIAAAIAYLRNNNKILKKPSIAETLNWAAALMALGKNKLDVEGANRTLGFVLKNREDINEFRKDGGFDGFFSEKHS